MHQGCPNAARLKNTQNYVAKTLAGAKNTQNTENAQYPESLAVAQIWGILVSLQALEIWG